MNTDSTPPPDGLAETAGSPTFLPSVLKLDYRAFTAWVRANRAQLSGDDIAWLNAWEDYDLACSPMDDEHRKLIRAGHNLGWWAHAANTKAEG